MCIHMSCHDEVHFCMLLFLWWCYYKVDDAKLGWHIIQGLQQLKTWGEITYYFFHCSYLRFLILFLFQHVLENIMHGFRGFTTFCHFFQREIRVTRKCVCVVNNSKGGIIEQGIIIFINTLYWACTSEVIMQLSWCCNWIVSGIILENINHIWKVKIFDKGIQLSWLFIC